MIGLTMKHLRYFDALRRFGHFGRAADACAVSQPALSVQIKELENMVGSPLVERGGRSIQLTTIGAQFAEKAQAILQSVDELGDLVRASQGPLAGPLKIGVIPTVAPYLLPEIIKTLTARFPTLEPQPREAVTGSLLQDLHDAKLDAAIIALPVSEPSLREFALFEEDFIFVRHRNDAHLPVPNAETLGEMRLLLLEEGHCFRDQALSFCSLPSTPRNLMEGSSLSTLVQMVGAGIGVTLIPEMALSLETRSADVDIVRFPAPAPSRTIGMVWRKSSPLSNDLMQIGAIVRSVGQKALQNKAMRPNITTTGL